MPEISIIIPAYNAEKSIVKTVQSILNQDFEDFEVLIVNDGSTDNTEKVSLEIGDSRIKVLSKVNGGLVSAYIHGIKHAEGKYIMFCDSDDFYKENILNMVYSNMESTDVDFSCYTYDLISEDGDIIHHSKNFYPEGIIKKADYEKIVFPNFVFNCSEKNFYYTLLVMRWVKIYKKELLLKIMADLNVNVSQMEDNICTYLCVLNSSSLYVSNTPIYNYVSIADSMSKGFNECIFEKYETSLNHISAILDKYNFNTNLQQLDYLRFDVYRVIYRRAAKALSYKAAKNVLKVIRGKKYSQNIKLKNITALKNKIFYVLEKLHLDYILYVLFRKA